MLILIFRLRVLLKCFRMIAHFHHLLLCPAIPQKPISSQIPFHLFSPDIPQKHGSPQTPFSFFLRNRWFHCQLTHVAKVSTVDSTQSPNFASKVSRVARIEAQVVLLDYLHATRGYGFTDAEYISKNSPNFLQSLLSEIDDHEDVASSLRKLFRYNPINEFEPFFESLGMKPSQIPLFLPRGMIYLSDDSVMLENFHGLCYYGIPRNRIGKIYKEAKEVFGYDSGLLPSKFQAYEKLGLSKSTVIKLVSCCPSLLIGDVNNHFKMVLERLNKIGIDNNWIGNYLTCNRTYNWKRMLDTMEFLDKVGYSETEMHNLFKTNPGLLFECSVKKVYLLFARLFKLGIKMAVIYSSFVQNPHLLSNKCIKNLLRVVDFLNYIGMGSEGIAGITSDHILLLSSHPLKGAKSVCSELKIQKADLCQLVQDNPFSLIKLASKLEQKSAEQPLENDPNKHLEKTTFLLKLGYAENSEEMAQALKRFRGRGDQLQERFDCLVEAGLDYYSVTEMIKRAPMILNQSKDIIEKKIDCLRNNLGYPLESVVAFPAYLCYDLERIFRRFSMYVWLREKNAAKPMLTLSTILASSDARFIKYFVNVHPEGPNVWEGLENLSPSK